MEKLFSLGCSQQCFARRRMENLGVSPSEQDNLAILGGTDVQVCQIRKRTMQEIINRGLPEFVVDPGNQ